MDTSGVKREEESSTLHIKPFNDMLATSAAINLPRDKITGEMMEDREKYNQPLQHVIDRWTNILFQSTIFKRYVYPLTGMRTYSSHKIKIKRPQDTMTYDVRAT